jgi:integrase
LAPGLYLVVQASGAKAWAMRFRRPDGRPAKLTLGRVDLSDTETADEPTLGGALTLRQARQLANQIDRQRARGVDVVEERKATQSRQKAAVAEMAANSFGAAVREFFIDHKTKRQTRPRRWRGDARLLGLGWPRGCDPATTEPRVIPGGLADVWAAKPVGAIDGHDIHALVDDSRKRGIPGLPRHNKGVSEARGRKMHAALSVFFGWLLQHRKVASNPAVAVWHPGAPPARERVLSDAEIVRFWRACDEVPEPYGAALQLLLLTGARLNEVAGMRHSELVDGVWTIPGERAKNHRKHQLALPPLALEIIAGMPRLESNFVFTVTGARPISGWSRVKAQLDKAMVPAERWTIHDLRRSCASGMQRLGIRVEVIERCLNHVSGSYRGVAGVYQRDPMSDETREALERWSQHIAGLVAGEPANVVAMRKR